MLRILALSFIWWLLTVPSSANVAFHKPGHIPPTGTCRGDDCPCSKEDEEKIKGLIGRLRALKDVADITRSANAGIGFGQDLHQGGSISSIQWDTWLNTGTQIVGEDALMNKAMEDLIIEAARKSGRVLNEKDFARAVREYGKTMKIPDTPITVGQVQTGVTVVRAANNVYGCIKATDDVVNDLSDYFEQRREAKQLKKQLKQIDDKIEAILKELEELRKRCPAEDRGSVGSPSWFRGDIARPQLLTVAAPVSVPDEDDRPNETVLRKLFTFRSKLRKAEARFRNRLFVPLSPFMIHTALSEMDPRLVFAISRAAFPDLKIWPKEIEEAVVLGQQIERDLQTRAVVRDAGKN